jgi:hypothetical protein
MWRPDIHASIVKRERVFEDHATVATAATFGTLDEGLQHRPAQRVAVTMALGKA